jgi:hypothetical protein
VSNPSDRKTARKKEEEKKKKDALVIFLSSGIPKSQLDTLAVDVHVSDVVLKDGRDVDLGAGADKTRKLSQVTGAWPGRSR